MQHVLLLRQVLWSGAMDVGSKIRKNAEAMVSLHSTIMANKIHQPRISVVVPALSMTS